MSRADRFICFKKKKKRGVNTTLLIGFRCKEGVFLVSDTKVVDTGNFVDTYQSKILMPLLGVPCIVGAAGDADLFREFNRKIPEIANRGLKKANALNIEALMNVGLTREEAIEYFYPYPQQSKIQQATPIELTKPLPTVFPKIDKTTFIPPYGYSGEDFLDDCKKLIVKLNQSSDKSYVEILMGLKGDTRKLPGLHYIDYFGREREIDTFYSIGSGSPYVKMFFDDYYESNKMNPFGLVKLALTAIIYTEMIAREHTVGWKNEKPPEVFAVLNDGKYGTYQFANIIQVLNGIKEGLSANFKNLKETLEKTGNGGIPDLEFKK